MRELVGAMPLACGGLYGGRGGRGWPLLIVALLWGVERVGAEAASAGSARVLELGAPSAPPLAAVRRAEKGTKVKEGGAPVVVAPAAVAPMTEVAPVAGAEEAVPVARVAPVAEVEVVVSIARGRGGGAAVGAEGTTACAFPVGSLPSKAGATLLSTLATGGAVVAVRLSGVDGEVGGRPWAGSLST